MKRTWRNLLYTGWDCVWIWLNMLMSTVHSRLSLALQGCPVGSGFRTTSRCWFKARRAGSIRIGRNVMLLSAHRSNRVGLSQPVLLQTMGDGEIEIGDHSGGSGLVISSRSSVRIGQHVKLGGNVRIYDHDYHSLDPAIRCTPQDTAHVKTRPVEIGDHVFVGVNAMILKGVSIGEKAIIGAGAVVTRPVPAGEIWGGNPAQRVQQGERS